MEKALEGIGYGAVCLFLTAGISLLLMYERALEVILMKAELEILWKSLANFGF